MIAKTFWVWTQQAQEKFPDRIAGTEIWEHYKIEAPDSLAESGDIVDSEDYEGQTDLLNFIKE